MGFAQSLTRCFQAYATFAGRASRSEFWWWALFVFVGGVIASLISDVLNLAFSLATLIPSIAVAARRLHDADRTGWWQLLSLLPLLGWIVLIVFYCGRGTPGPNRFGDAPFSVGVSP